MSKFVRITVPKLTDLDLLKKTLVAMGFPEAEIVDVTLRKQPGLRIERHVYQGYAATTFEFADEARAFACCGDEDDAGKITRYLRTQNPMHTGFFPDSLAQWYSVVAVMEALEAEGLTAELSAEEGGRLRVLAA